jgi:hypothetical protein
MHSPHKHTLTLLSSLYACRQTARQSDTTTQSDPAASLPQNMTSVPVGRAPVMTMPSAPTPSEATCAPVSLAMWGTAPSAQVRPHPPRLSTPSLYPPELHRDPYPILWTSTTPSLLTILSSSAEERSPLLALYTRGVKLILPS